MSKSRDKKVWRGMRKEIVPQKYVRLIIEMYYRIVKTRVKTIAGMN